MKEVTLYYADGFNIPFANKEEAIAQELKIKEMVENMNKNSPSAILEKLYLDLKQASYIPEGTIGTCSYQEMSIRNMVKCCQEFVDKYKEYLKYY
jgi:ubiquinone biosynthesis protein Coq4